MSTFKPKRVSGADLVSQIGSATASLPASVPMVPIAAPAPAMAPKPQPLKKVQINFQASEQFADLVAIEAEKAGSTRRFFARLLRDAGYDVPEADVNPPDTRRRRGQRELEG
jgi:hypothetical protein